LNGNKLCLLVICLMVSSAMCVSISDFIVSGKDPVVKVYKKEGIQYLRMLLVNPDGHNRGDKSPAVVWIHGGGWTGGCPEQFIAHCRWSASRGGVGIAISYRLLEKPDNEDDFTKGPSIADCIEDCRDAVKYIRANADELGVDHDKIAVVGDSAGAHLALCLGIFDGPADSRPSAVVNCNGIADMTKEPWIKFVKADKNKQNRDELAKAFSPIYHLGVGMPPVLTMNGANDHVVKPADSEIFHKQCLASGVDSEYVLWPDARHAFILTDYTASDSQINQAIAAIDSFLVQHGILNNVTDRIKPIVSK
jgi:acetyl esterase